MTRDEDFKLLKFQTCVLRVNIHCDGCKQKVKKILQRTEGVYQVNIDAEQQKVTVLGGVDSATLIKKLVRAGKHAELWSQKTHNNQSQKQKANCIKDDKSHKGGGGQQKQQGLVKGLEALKNQQKFPLNLEEDEDYLDDEEYDEEEEELRFLREKANQINLFRQQAAAMQANNAKKGFGAEMAAANNGKMNSNNNNNNNNGVNGSAGKKGNRPPPNQNSGVKVNPVEIDQKTMQALKMNNAQYVSSANVNPGEGKKGNDVNSMMNLAGFHGNGGTNNKFGSVLGGNLGSNPSAGGVYHQVQPNGFMGSASAGFPAGGGVAGMATGHHPSAVMMNMSGGYHHPHQQQQHQPPPQQQQHQQQYSHPSSMLMNLQNRHALQQPQMMFNRSPLIPANTGYYCSYGPPVPPYGMITDPSYYRSNPNGDVHHSATSDMFSDENTSSCSIL